MSARSVVNRLGWVVVTIILVSAFWVFYYNIGLGGGGDEIMVAGEKKVGDTGCGRETWPIGRHLHSGKGRRRSRT